MNAQRSGRFNEGASLLSTKKTHTILWDGNKHFMSDFTGKGEQLFCFFPLLIHVSQLSLSQGLNLNYSPRNMKFSSSSSLSLSLSLAHTHARRCVSVCVCVWEREREREREKDGFFMCIFIFSLLKILDGCMCVQKDRVISDRTGSPKLLSCYATLSFLWVKTNLHWFILSSCHWNN